MTAKESPEFFAALAKLAVMHRITMDKATAKVYYDALNDVPIGLLLAAMARLLDHAGEFMPTSGKVREIVDEIQDEQHRRTVAEIERPQHLALTGTVETPRQPYFDCTVCEDTGMKKLCPGGCTDFDRCTRREGDYCPEYHEGRYRVPIAPCECAATNPTILRRRKAVAQPKPYSKRKKRYDGGRNYYGDAD